MQAADSFLRKIFGVEPRNARNKKSGSTIFCDRRNLAFVKQDGPKINTRSATSSKPAGYSGTPLAKKLGMVEGVCVFTSDAPANYLELLNPLPSGVAFSKKISQATDLVHLFRSHKADLKKDLAALRRTVKSNCAVWVSWPKQSSKVPTDITENTIRELALPLGFVDVKVCAVSEIWSGLKLVIRKELR
jgi:hypothetical protein